jgi:hypothetical protein
MINARQIQHGAMRPALMGAALALALLAACAHGSRPSSAPVATAPSATTLAKIYYWRAKPGKLDEYSAYIRDVAEPIDHEAQRHGAFLSVTTYVAHDTTSSWTHMRVFLLRDSVQLAALGGQLDSAGMRLQPDSVKRRERSQYSATLRDRVGDVTVELLR